MTDPNAPTTPPTGDPGTGSGAGLDNTATTDPNAPAGADQAGTPEDSPFTPEQTEGLPEDVQGRVKGMVASYTKAQQSVREKERRLQEMIDKLERERLSRESSEAVDPEPTAQPESEDEEVYKGLDPSAKEWFKKYERRITEKVTKQFAPVAAGAAQARATAELTAARAQHKDFDQVVTYERAQTMLRANPNLNWDTIYKLSKFDSLNGALAQSQAQLAKYQMAEKKKAAAVEMPSGPIAEDLSNEWYDKLPREQRVKLSSVDIARMNDKHRTRAT